MGVVDGFDSMWSNAKSTFGQGTPQEGARFDNSAQLRQMQSDVYSARPDSRWTGSASDSYASANDKQGRVLGQIADLDQRLRTEVDRSAQVVNAGRQNLDSVRQWVHDAAATVPAGALQDEILGTTTPIDSKDSINNMSPEMASKHILSAMVAVGQDVPLPHAYYEDGQLVGYPQGAQAVIVDGEIVCPPGVYPPDFLAAVTTATNEVLGPVPGGNSAAEGMAGRYTGVTENPDPNG